AQAQHNYAAEGSGRHSTTKENSAEQSVSESILGAGQTRLRSSAGFLLRLESDQIQSNLRQKIRLDRNLLRQRFTSLFFFIVVIIIGISAVIGISSWAHCRQVILL